MLLEAGASADRKCNGLSPTHVAVHAGAFHGAEAACLQMLSLVKHPTTHTRTHTHTHTHTYTCHTQMSFY